MNDVQRLLAAHRTIRRFADELVDDACVARCVAAAQQTSTSSNIQAYTLLRVRDAGTRAQLAELCGGQPQVERAGAFFVVCGDQRRHRLVAERAGVPYEPNLETFLLALVDASLFAQSLVTAFESEELGVCYIGGLRNRLPEVDRLLELPADVLGLFGLCVGVPAEVPARRPRLAPEAVVAEERYPDDARVLAAVDEYDERMRAYYAERGKPGWDWSGGLARKFQRRHREHLLEHYAEKGAAFR